MLSFCSRTFLLPQDQWCAPIFFLSPGTVAKKTRNRSGKVFVFSVKFDIAPSPAQSPALFLRSFFAVSLQSIVVTVRSLHAPSRLPPRLQIGGSLSSVVPTSAISPPLQPSMNQTGVDPNCRTSNGSIPNQVSYICTTSPLTFNFLQFSYKVADLHSCFSIWLNTCNYAIQPSTLRRCDII